MTETIITANEALFFDLISCYLNVKELKAVRDAYEMARQAHGSQKRKSGEPFFLHPLSVAYYLARYRLDTSALIAALLHDVAEDTRVSIGEIEAAFGPETAVLVNGVTKFNSETKSEAESSDKTYKPTRQEIETETLHKLLALMIKDPRVVLIKLFDRLHNMRTIGSMPHHKQVGKAQETLAVYAQLANRLGMWNVKNELEAISLEIVDEKAYQTISQRLQDMERFQEPFYQHVSDEVCAILQQEGIESCQVQPEPYNIFTVFQDYQQNDNNRNGHPEIPEELRLEIVVGETIDCYRALGYLHSVWKPVPDKLNDYIAAPRANLYRSLHTTVVHSSGRHLKLRLRTEAMDKVSEIGVLAKWKYADTPFWSKGIANRMELFLEDIAEQIGIDPKNASAGVQGVMEDVFGQAIEVYTPNGDTKRLVRGATAVDFAYAIHTGLGNQCHEAFVNNKQFPLNKPLRNGDVVRIKKHTAVQPQRIWLNEDLRYTATNYARNHIRRWFRRLPDGLAIKQGKELLADELAILNMPDFNHWTIAEIFNYEFVEDLYLGLGRAEILPSLVATRVLQANWHTGAAVHLDSIVRDKTGQQYIISNAGGRKLQLCRHCQPRPGKAILGRLRNDNSLTVHSQICHYIRREKTLGRLLKVEWGSGNRQAQVITVQIRAYDRPGLLNEISRLMQRENINITYIHMSDNEEMSDMGLILSVRIERPRHLVRILHQIQTLINIISVQILHTGPPPLKTQPNQPGQSLYRPE